MADYKAIIKRWVEGGWNNGNLNLVDDLYSPDFEIHDSTSPVPVKGYAAFKSYVQMFRTALLDIHFTIDDMVEDGDKVAWRWTATGTHLGELMGAAPSGKTASVTGIVISRFENGKWREDEINWDTLGMLQQLDIIPA